MAEHLYNLVVPRTKYLADGGITKTAWLTVGKLIRTDQGNLLVKLNCIPTQVCDPDGNDVPWEGWINVFEVREREDSPAQKGREIIDDPDDVPF